MPRGQKSKLHARAKRNQARGDAQAYGAIQESAEAAADAEAQAVEEAAGQEAEESSVSSQSPSDAPQKVTSATITSMIFSSSESDESFYEESIGSEESGRPPAGKFFTINPHQELIAKKAIVLLQFLLHNYNMKQLTTKEEMLRVITKKHEKDFPEILRKASEKLEDAFAVEVQEVDSSGPSYNLISKLKLPNNGRIRAGKGLPKTGFLMSILSIIFIRGNCASEEDIWKILKKQQIYPRKKHRIFGEPWKLMTQYLVRLKYLEYRQVAGSDPPCYEFLWGPQAHAETSKMKVLEFLAKINNTTPRAISALYEEALLKELEGEAGDKASPLTTVQASEVIAVECPEVSTNHADTSSFSIIQT